MPIRFEKAGHIALITIDRYEKRNAFDVDHAEQLMACWDEVRDNPEIRTAIITGVRDSFCSGGDLNAMRDIAHETATLGRSPSKDRMTRNGTAYFTLKGFDIFKPIVAAVNGHCIAGGMELLGGTDIRVASDKATFSISEVRRGLFAGGGTTARLPRQLNWPAAMELLLVGEDISAERAKAIGLVNQIAPPERLIEAAYAWAEKIAANAPIAVQATKKSALLGFRAASLDEAYRIEDMCHDWVYTSEDAQEGATAFLERRKPCWRGR
jgi:enoyl-CoA hydratase